MQLYYVSATQSSTSDIYAGLIAMTKLLKIDSIAFPSVCVRGCYCVWSSFQVPGGQACAARGRRVALSSGVSADATRVPWSGGTRVRWRYADLPEWSSTSLLSCTLVGFSLDDGIPPWDSSLSHANPMSHGLIADSEDRFQLPECAGWPDRVKGWGWAEITDGRSGLCLHTTHYCTRVESIDAHCARQLGKW